MAGPLQTLLNRAPIPFVKREGNRILQFGGAGVAQNEEAQMAQMEKVSTLFSIIDLVATKVASVDWHLYRRSNEPEAERIEVFDHPALVVWENPSTVDAQTIYTQDEFIEATQQHYELTGEMDIVLETRTVGRMSAVTDLWPVRPDRLTPVKDRTRFLAGYVYEIGGEKIPLELDQVIVEKRQNPLDPYRGLSPVAALMLDIEGEKAAAAYNHNFFVNGAVPGGVLELGNDALLSDREWEEFVQRWRSQHQGVSNAHRIAVMEMGKFSERKVTQRDMEFVDLRNFSKAQMMEAWRVSKAMLGVVEDVNRSNNEAQQDIFVNEVLIPRLERWKKLLNKKLLPRFGALGEGVEFDYDDPTPVNAMDERLEERARVSNVVDLVTVGFAPAEVLEHYELPPLTYVGPPENGARATDEESVEVETAPVDVPAPEA